MTVEKETLFDIVKLSCNPIIIYPLCLGIGENKHFIWVIVMVFDATFNNSSVISWWSVLLVDDTRVPEENHQHVTSH